MQKIMFVISLLLFVAGCATQDAYTGEKKTSSATKGAGIGAVTGAIIGAATSSKKDREKGILTGAAAGAAIGGGVGYYMDQQEKKLRERLAGTGVQVRREGNDLYLIMPGNITFATGRYEIRSDFYPVLNSVADVLKEFQKTAVKVSGHTDSTGSAQFNQTLSEQRADSVKDYLVNRGVASGRVHSVGYGFRYPIATNDTAAGREQNRRVEIQLEPLE